MGARRRCIATIVSWAKENGFPGIVWTDLDENFESEIGEPFTVPNAIVYLDGLPKLSKETAMKYIRNAPEEISTPLRRELFATD